MNIHADYFSYRKGYRDLLIEGQRKSLLKLFASNHIGNESDKPDQNDIFDHIKKMERLNEMNWQWFFHWYSTTDPKVQSVSPGDIECIQIGIAVMDTCKFKGEDIKKHLMLESIKIRVNLYSMVVTNSKDHVKLMLKALTNKR